MEVTKEYEFLKDTIIESSNDTGEIGTTTFSKHLTTLGLRIGFPSM